jgi:hypothetical protein
LKKETFTNHPLGGAVLKKNSVRINITRQFSVLVTLPMESNWNGKDGTYKTKDLIFSESNLIFPLPSTGTCFPFATEIWVGVVIFSK